MKNYFKFIVYLFVALGFSSAMADSYTEYFRAVRGDNYPAIQRLLDRGFDPNSVDPEGRTGLHMAVEEEAFRVIRVLLAHPDIKVDQPNAAGETPLMTAAIKGYTDVCRSLIAKGATINKPGWTPLHYAAASGGTEPVELMLEHHAYIDATSPNGTTPLMMAARYGAQAAADLLLEEGADPTPRNSQGLNAADFARGVDRERLADQLERRARAFGNTAPKPPAP